jgi:predicted ATPase/DNA-binding CsgD family transcriptional regulator
VRDRWRIRIHHGFRHRHLARTAWWSRSYRDRTGGTTLKDVTTVGPAKGMEVTAREAEVLALLARHLTNAQIADALFISARTVESHVSALLRKLQLPDRRSLARHVETMPGLGVTSARRAPPVPVTTFIGRTAERAALAEALAEHRMVTATGPGGVGKTRLALNVAADVAPAHSDGVWFVDLVHVTDPAMVTATVAETIGVPEQRSVSVDVALVASLAERDALLVLDNCEHLLPGVRDCVERILAGCPDITVLATSRTRLLVPYEWVYAVPGLSVTGDGGDAVDLFAARVAAATGDATPPDSVRVAALCRALDGMALAIELAAARYSTLGLDGLEAGLDQRLRFLAAGTRVADRHRSLRDAIGWSYDLLSSEDRALLRGVALFASWFDVEAAYAVAGSGNERAAVADGLARLADHSLLVVERGDPTRYRALETIRQYGVERLGLAGELDAVRGRHEAWCGAVMGALRTAEPDDAWCARFDSVVDDIRAALLCAACDEQCRAQAAALTGDLAGLLFARGRPMEAQRRYEQAADLAPTAAEQADYLRLAAGAAASRFVGDDALRLFRMAADTAVTIGDRPGAARDLATMAMYIGRTPGILAERHLWAEAATLLAEARAASDGSPRAEAAIAVATELGGPPDLDQARRAVELAERAGDGIVESAALDWLTAVNVAIDDIAEAVRVARRRIDLLSTLAVGAPSGFEFSDGHLMASDVDLAAGDLAGAAAHAAALAGLPFYRDEDHLAVCRRLTVDALAGHFDDVIHTGELFRIGWERAGRPVASTLCRAAYSVAMVHGMRGDDDGRAAWVRVTIDAGSDPEKLAGCRTGWAPTFDALLALHRDDPAAAVRRLAADIDDPDVFGFWDSGLWRPWYAALWAEAAVLDHHPDAATRIDRSRHAARNNPIATAIVERAAAIAAGDNATLVRFAITFAQLGCLYQHARTGRIAAGLR